jgi:hypothetical protein
VVKKIWVAHDCGKALSRRIVEGQIEGSTYMGFGEALMEEHEVDAAHRGAHAGPSLLDYRMPTFLDTPEIEAMIVEAPDANGPYGAKEAGEGPLHSSIPAIANAIYDAVGVRIDRCRSRRRGCWRRSRSDAGASRPASWRRTSPGRASTRPGRAPDAAPAAIRGREPGHRRGRGRGAAGAARARG